MKKNWRKWGPYQTDSKWCTVREDYSPFGSVWEYISHDAARSKAYRWGEEGIAGISDENQLLCFALSFRNGEDPILKERYFGLTGNEGNHGEDVAVTNDITRNAVHAAKLLSDDFTVNDLTGLKPRVYHFLSNQRN